METKTCSKCGEIKAVEFFVKKRKVCVLCRKENCRIYYISYYKKNRDRKIHKSREWYKKNKERHHVSTAKWKTENKELVKKSKKKSAKKYYEKNKDKLRQYATSYHKLNTQKAREKSKKHTDSISDKYTRKALRKKGFTKDQITPDLIELQRAIIKLKRGVRNDEHHRTKQITM